MFAKAGAIVPLARSPRKTNGKIRKPLKSMSSPERTTNSSLRRRRRKHCLPRRIPCETVFSLKADEQSLDLEIEVRDEKGILPDREIKLVFRNVKRDSKVSSVSEYDGKLKAHIVSIRPGTGEKIRVRLETAENSIIDASFDYIGRIMDLLDRSTYKTRIKTEIGFLMPSHNHNREGLLGRICVPKLCYRKSKPWTSTKN